MRYHLDKLDKCAAKRDMRQGDAIPKIKFTWPKNKMPQNTKLFKKLQSFRRVIDIREGRHYSENSVEMYRNQYSHITIDGYSRINFEILQLSTV